MKILNTEELKQVSGGQDATLNLLNSMPIARILGINKIYAEILSVLRSPKF